MVGLGRRLTSSMAGINCRMAGTLTSIQHEAEVETGKPGMWAKEDAGDLLNSCTILIIIVLN